MPIMYDPANQATVLDPIVVTGAKLVYYTLTPKDVITGPVDADTPTLEEDLALPPPDAFDGPDPLNCNDVAFMLQEAVQKRDTYTAARQVIEGLGMPDELITVLTALLTAAGIVGIQDQLQRFQRVVEVVTVGYNAFRASRAGSIIGLGYAILWAATWGTEGRWDAKIAALESLSDEWECGL